MNKQSFQLDDKTVWAIEWGQGFTETRRRYDHIDYCHLTGSKIDDAQSGYLFICWPLFPNAIVLKTEADKIGLVETARKLAELWKEAQKYKHWFEV